MKKLMFGCLLASLMGMRFIGCGDTRRVYISAEGDSADFLELQINLPFAGNLTPGDVDTFTVVLEKGVTYKLVLTNTTDDSVVVLQVCDPDGNLLATSEGGVLEFTPTEGGLHVFKIRTASGDVQVNYSFTVVLEAKDGKDGKDGADGKDGQDGADGQDGQDGQDGADGQDGQDGQDGADGKDGADGQDGRDGIAAILSRGTFLLCNHKDGTARPPFYGLRLDELFDKNEGLDKFTFSFEEEGHQMLLDFDGTTIRIYGTAYGGWDIGGMWSPECQGTVAIDFTYPVSQVAFADDDIVVLSPMTGSGTITWKPGTEEEVTISLMEKANDDGLVFRLGNEMDDDGHRREKGVSGWGWLSHPNRELLGGTSDWLFTLKQLPPEEEEEQEQPQ